MIDNNGNFISIDKDVAKHSNIPTTAINLAARRVFLHAYFYIYSIIDY